MDTQTFEHEAPARDVEANFHGNRVVYLHWADHLSFCAAMAFPLPPSMPFGAVLSEVMPAHYGMHPDWSKIDWDKVRWELDGKEVSPDPGQTLESLGVRHKSLLRLFTPGLEGFEGSRS